MKERGDRREARRGERERVRRGSEKRESEND